MVRYLVVLECFLLLLLVSPWFAALPRDSTPAEQAAEEGAVFATGRGVQSSEQPPAARSPDGALSPVDRAMLARELLGLPSQGASVVGQAALQRHDDRPAANGSASLVHAPAALPATKPPAMDQQQPARAKRAIAEDRWVPSPAMIMAAQRHLARLGYSPGAADGVLGERTRRALADYRQRTGATADGAISETLLARLRRDAYRASARGSQARRVAARSSRSFPVESAPRWVASIAGGFQRLLGHEFDSRKQPARIREYCRVNHDTWIFDEGRRAFAYCGHLLAAY